MIDVLAAHRPAISDALSSIVLGSSYLDDAGSWGADFRRRLEDFALRGKLIRGSLVATGAELFGHTPDAACYRVAAAVELVQSFLLIHDDIMDEDALRRGEATVFEQYRRLGADGNYHHPSRFGESMGICAGDVALLLAVEAVATGDLPAETRVRLVRLISTEIAAVGVAQMADVANSHSQLDPSEDDILSVYRYKTGRYTFSLPLALGATLAGAPQAEIAALVEWGELEGIIFQVRDDQLGLVQESGSTGKTQASDVVSDKRTLHRRLLFEFAPGTEWQHVLKYFGKPVSEGQLSEIRSALNELGVIARLNGEVEKLGARSESILKGMVLSNTARKMLQAISAYNRNRTA